jgi:hypothetical protein
MFTLKLFLLTETATDASAEVNLLHHRCKDRVWESEGHGGTRQITPRAMRAQIAKATDGYKGPDNLPAAVLRNATSTK